MKKWYFIESIIILVAVLFLVFLDKITLFFGSYDWGWLNNPFIIVPLSIVIAVPLWLFVFRFVIKMSLSELANKEMSVLEEEYYLSSEKLEKIYISRKVKDFGGFLMFITLALFVSTAFWKFDLSFLTRLVAGLWLYWFILVGSRNAYYKKELLTKK